MRRKLERRRSRSADSLRRMITESKQDVLHGGEVRQIPGFDGETDFAVVQRKSEGDDLNQIRRMSGSDMRGRGSNGHRRQVSEGGRLEGGGGGGGGEGGERGSQKVEVGLLLAMDYSGMDQLEKGQAALDDTALLKEVDGQVRGRARAHSDASILQVSPPACMLPKPQTESLAINFS